MYDNGALVDMRVALPRQEDKYLVCQLELHTSVTSTWKPWEVEAENRPRRVIGREAQQTILLVSPITGSQQKSQHKWPVHKEKQIFN